MQSMQMTQKMQEDNQIISSLLILGENKNDSNASTHVNAHDANPTDINTHRKPLQLKRKLANEDILHVDNVYPLEELPDQCKACRICQNSEHSQLEEDLVLEKRSELYGNLVNHLQQKEAYKKLFEQSMQQLQLWGQQHAVAVSALYLLKSEGQALEQFLMIELDRHKRMKADGSEQFLMSEQLNRQKISKVDCSEQVLMIEQLKRKQHKSKEESEQLLMIEQWKRQQHISKADSEQFLMSRRARMKADCSEQALIEQLKRQQHISKADFEQLSVIEQLNREKSMRADVLMLEQMNRQKHIKADCFEQLNCHTRVKAEEQSS